MKRLNVKRRNDACSGALTGCLSPQAGIWHRSILILAHILMTKSIKGIIIHSAFGL